MTFQSRLLWVLAFVGGTLAASSAIAACPSIPTAQRFTLNGTEVSDSRTGLVWARCSIGQSWTGTTCSGTASTFPHEDALAVAEATSGWRMPNVKELFSLIDDGCMNPALDAVAFPGTSNGPYWSTTPHTEWPTGTWTVWFSDGQIGSLARDANQYPVRLVRKAP